MDAHQLATPPKSQGCTRDCDVGVDDLISQQLQNELDVSTMLTQYLPFSAYSILVSWSTKGE